MLFALLAPAQAQTLTYYVPPGVTNLRAMIVGGTPLGGGTSQLWRDFCAAQRVGLAQTLADLPAIAATSGHPEIANAPFATCGTSAGASAAASTAIANPTRALAVVGLHGVMFAQGNTGFNANRSGENGDVPTLDFSGAYGLPMIHNFDNNDGFINPVVLQGLVEFGRAHGAPWTFFIHNDGNHTDNNTALTTLIFPWLAAVFDARLPASAGIGDGSVTLNAIVETNGWLGDIKTKAVASYAAYAGDRTKADWFPNQSVATIWSGYHFLPPYNIPPQPVVAPSGLIADLTILDPLNNDTSSGTGWKIKANFKEADQAGSLVKYFILAPPPASVAGLDWIRPITPGKNYVAYTADPIFTFRVTADATVFIAHSDQGTSRPAWLVMWTNTGEQLVVTSGNLNSNAPRYTLFKKDFAANSIVTGGANGTPPSGQMHLTLVKPLGAQTLPSVTVTATDASATEGGDPGAFTVTRTGATTEMLTVNFSVSGTATGGADFSSLGTNLTFAPGQSNATLTVTPLDDALVEGAETAIVTLSSNAAYALGAPSSATVTISDNDSSGGGMLIFTNQIFATYVTGQNTRNVTLDLYLPASGPGPYPVFLWLPGGGWATQNKNSIPSAMTNLTALGYAVASANYSSSGNAKWPAQIWDAKAAVRWLRGNAAQFNLDPARLAAAGNSSGGHIAAFLGTSGGTRKVIVGGATVDIEGALGTNVNLSSRVQAALPFFPPTDLLVMDHYFTPGVANHNAPGSPESGLMGAAIQTIPEKTATANPMLFVGSNAPPFFITHGTADALVPFNQSELLNASLVRAGTRRCSGPCSAADTAPACWIRRR